MADFVEGGLEIVDRIADRHGDKIYESVQKINPLSSQYPGKTKTDDGDDDRQSQNSGSDHRRSQRYDQPRQRGDAELLPEPHHNNKRDNSYYYNAPDTTPSNYSDFDRQSQSNSERVIRDYENERDDPSRPPPNNNYNYYANSRRSRKNMSYGYDDRRPSSQGRGRYDDDQGSDYDERSGHRHRSTGRGYDDRDRGGYDREIIETEVYRGPPRQWSDQRSSSYQDNGDYAVSRYPNNNELAPYDNKRRSRSRGRHDRDYDDDKYTERGENLKNKFEDKLDETFDTTPRGIGAGIAGAVVGSLAARQFGDKRHTTRDMIIGAVVGGLAVNAAEQKYQDYRENKREERYEERYDGRSRSAMR